MQGALNTIQGYNPADKTSSAAATRIDLIRTHMQTLDKLCNILLHENCGACLTNQ